MAAMRKYWPGMRGQKLDTRTAVWRGPLKPSFQTFIVRVAFKVPLVGTEVDLMKVQPVVEVVKPKLKRNFDPGSKEGSLPHVYGRDTPKPSLCLFDPDTEEWSPNMLLADTTIPWAVEWLSFYEFWTVTGEWAGGGRHPGGSEQTGRGQ